MMYQKAEFEFVAFDVEDVIVTSGCRGSGGHGDGNNGVPIIIPPGNENAPDPE